MRIAIIGGGSIGQRHARNAQQLGHDVDVYDSDRRKGDPLWLFRPSDAAMICTPASTHAEVAVNLLSLGYRGPLFVEKPIDVVADSLIFRSWPSSVTMVGYNWRFHPLLDFWREAQPSLIECTCHTDMREWPGTGYADPLLECSHELDFVMSRLGRIDEICVAPSLSPFTIGIGLRLGHARGWSRIVLRWFERPFRAFRFEYETAAIDIQPGVGPGDQALDQSYVAELKHFLACVEDGRPTDIPFEHGLQVVEICQRVKELAN